MAQPDRAATVPLLEVARTGIGRALDFSAAVESLPPATDTYPDDGFAQQLALTARLIAADIGIKTVVVPFSGDFDTHENHRTRHDQLMARMNAAIGPFLDDLDTRGLSNRVVIATMSEFGRRLEPNDNAGVDHGAASNFFVIGPVHSGVYGAPVQFTNPDNQGNARATVTMNDYYATLIQPWLGVNASEVLTGSATVLPNLIAT